MGYEESKIQQACVMWFRYQYSPLAKLLIAVPNAGKRSTKVISTRNGYKTVCIGGKRAKDEGMVAGVSDLILLTPKKGYGCLCIEMKTEDGDQSKAQKEWQAASEKGGNKYVVVRNYDEFRSEIEDYLGKIDEKMPNFQ
ncbi:MAG: hypothetical protein A2X18_07600 [Bacteroidetes bacterium GWF2_40_14]|nr:MAG: hypothetical protein A2X18_07600 [Bacteroidetes bacterium GWF2_40_14]